MQSTNRVISRILSFVLQTFPAACRSVLKITVSSLTGGTLVIDSIITENETKEIISRCNQKILQNSNQYLGFNSHII